MLRLVLLLLALLPFLFGGRRLPAAPPQVEIVAHRGASWDAPENTLASVKLGWAQDADAVEVDVMLSRDGQIVLFHDRTTKRTAKVEGVVADLTLAELKRLDVGAWKNERFAGERVPTLAEVLATIPANRRMFIEVKTGPEIVPELVRVLKESGLQPEQTTIISFSDAVVAAVKKARPDLPVYWIVDRGSKNRPPPRVEDLIARARMVRADGLDLSARPLLTSHQVRQVKEAGLYLGVWTVNDVKVARQLIEAGVEGITTDRPAWLREQLR